MANISIDTRRRLRAALQSTPCAEEVLDRVDNPYSSIVTDSDGATIAFDCAVSSKHVVTLGGNRILAVAGDAVGQTFWIWLKQDGSGNRTVTWWSGISWPGGSPPTLTVTAAKYDVFAFVKLSAGVYHGFVVGQNI
jgi:hypothetical protein